MIFFSDGISNALTDAARWLLCLVEERMQPGQNMW